MKTKPKITNINKEGKEFSPSSYKVSKDTAPELYRLLEVKR